MFELTYFAILPQEDFEDVDFIFSYIEDNFHHGDILERIKQSLEEKQLESNELEKSQSAGIAVLEEVDEIEEQFHRLKRIEKVDPKLESAVRDIRNCQNSIKYIKLIEWLKEINVDMNRYKSEDNINMVVDHYQKLRTISEVAYKSACLKMRILVIDPLVKKWSESLREPIIRFINDELKAINYPFDDISHHKQIKKDLTEFQKHLEILDQVNPDYLRLQSTYISRLICLLI